MKMDWNTLTYKQAKAIQTANDIEDITDKTIAIAQAVFGDSVVELPINEFNLKCKELEFLKTPIKDSLVLKDITVNGREYYFDGKLGKISTAQYVDFLNFIKAEDEAKAFSVFMIPKGHKYNDGYDMLQVFDDIQDMPMQYLHNASFFFSTQLKLFIKIFRHYSVKRIKKMKLQKEMKENMEKILMNMEYFPTF